MSEKLPTLANTYLKSTKLYARTLIDVLPFLLLLMLSKFILDKAWPEGSIINAAFFARIMVDSGLSALFFSFILYIMYQKNNAQNIQMFEVIKQGAYRFPQVFFAYLLISLPIFFSFILIKIDTTFWQPYVITPDFVEKQRWLTLGILGAGMLTTILLAIFSFVAGIYIIAKNEKAVSGLRQSFKMVQVYWTDTFLIIALFGIISMSLAMILDDLHVPMSVEILILLFSSFYPALMIIHYENMAQRIKALPSLVLPDKHHVKAI